MKEYQTSSNTRPGSDLSPILTPESNIFVAGHRGMVGSAIVRHLHAQGLDKIVTRTRAELDLTRQQAVYDFFQGTKIDYVVLASARVGGIHANNTYPAEFIYQNLMIAANVIDAAFHSGVERLLFLGSSCIYPKHAPQPMKEQDLLTGALEPTNEPYGVAKIAGIKLCESYNRQYGTKYRSVMPTNLYGPNDNFHLGNSHVIPALIRKFHLAKLAYLGDTEGIQRDELIFGAIPEELRATLNSGPVIADTVPAPVIVWGTGTPRREFIHVDDLAAACVFLMGLADDVYTSHTQPMLSHINVGVGADVTIAEVTEMIREVVGYEGPVVFDRDKPDGTPRKLLDISLIKAMGWTPSIDLRAGLSQTYQWYLKKSQCPDPPDNGELTTSLV